MIVPPHLKAGDKVRFVSPASTPDREAVSQRAKIVESWGLKVDFGQHVFSKQGYLAGTDEERLADFNAALRDPEVRAIVTTRGGKGSYRIADRLDFQAARNDPKFVLGFSDITILHLALWKHCGLVGIHGALMDDGAGGFTDGNRDSVRRALMTDEDVSIQSRPDESSAALTTTGAARGSLIGGNLDMVSTAAGWALPKLDGAILMLEAVNMHVGQVDRQLTMLRKAGHLDGLAGVAIGQFTGFESARSVTVIDVLREHVALLGVPVLGGLPLGHGVDPSAVPVGAMALLDTATRTLTATLRPVI